MSNICISAVTEALCGVPDRQKEYFSLKNSEKRSENVKITDYFPVMMCLMSLSLLSASIGVRLLMSVCRISSRT